MRFLEGAVLWEESMISNVSVCVLQRVCSPTCVFSNVCVLQSLHLLSVYVYVSFRAQGPETAGSGLDRVKAFWGFVLILGCTSGNVRHPTPSTMCLDTFPVCERVCICVCVTMIF